MINDDKNTKKPVLWVIEKRYRYKVYFSKESGYEEWLAEKGKCILSATSPQELLGLIIMYQELGDDWQSFGGYDFYDQIMERSIAEEDNIMQYKRKYYDENN